jgi:hypothetical protein
MWSGVGRRLRAAAARGGQRGDQREGRSRAVRATEPGLGEVVRCAVAVRGGGGAVAGRRRALVFRGQGWWRRRGVALEQLPRAGELGVHVAGGEQSVVADFGVAVGQHVQQEAADELVRGQRAGIAVLGAEGDGGGGDRHQPAVT